MSKMHPLKHVDTHMCDLISELQTLIRQPSVSAKNEGIEECAHLVKKMLDSSDVLPAIETISRPHVQNHPALYHKND